MDFQTFATIQSIVTAQIELVKISTPILLILGNFGEISSIIVFVQRSFRTNSCAIYFLAASCLRLLFINYVILSNGLAVVYNIDLANTSVVYCKIKYYIAGVTTMLPLSFVVCASIDRFMLSSRSARVRNWSHPRIAFRLIAGMTIFWMIFTIHALIGVTILPGPTGPFCYIQPGPYTLFGTFYSIIINYSLPPILMIIFGLLTIANVRQAQRQIRPLATGGYAQRKDRHLLYMLLFQVLINIIFTIPGSAYQIYRVITDSWQKDLIWRTWDVFFFLLAAGLYYIPSCVSFYIYTITAGVFREEFKRIAIGVYRRFRPQRRIQMMTVRTVSS